VRTAVRITVSCSILSDASLSDFERQFILQNGRNREQNKADDHPSKLIKARSINRKVLHGLQLCPRHFSCNGLGAFSINFSLNSEIGLAVALIVGIALRSRPIRKADVSGRILRWICDMTTNLLVPMVYLIGT
jgi:hypothetical protein